MAGERISKVLADAGVASRRASDALVAAGRVTVDGRPAFLGERVDARGQVIAVDGHPLDAEAPASVYLVVHKPVGVTSTVRDRHAQRTVLDLVPGDLAPDVRLYPVGRLDRDSEGLLLLTNDGEWAERVLHPRFGVEREYAIAVDRPLFAEQVDALERGVTLEEGIASLARLRLQTRTETRSLAALIAPRPDERWTWYRAVLEQGWKRQLRRMFGVVGSPVRRLVRVRVGSVRIDDLRAGDVRRLSATEARRLVSAGRGR